MHLVNKVLKTDRAFLFAMHPLIPQCVYFASIPRNHLLPFASPPMIKRLKSHLLVHFWSGWKKDEIRMAKKAMGSI